MRLTALSTAAAALSVIGLLGGCDRPAPPPPTNAIVESEPVVMPDAPAAGCADHWTVGLARESFASNGAGRKFAPSRLDGFLGQVAIAATGAVNEACAAGEIAPAKAASVKQLVVVSASGAASPDFSEPGTPATLRLQHAFAETDLAIPSEMELRAGLACWADPASAQCLEYEP